MEALKNGGFFKKNLIIFIIFDAICCLNKSSENPESHINVPLRLIRGSGMHGFYVRSDSNAFKGHCALSSIICTPAKVL